MIDSAFRAKLAAMCLDRGKRINGMNQQVANRWHPHRVRHPDTYRFCTEEEAWGVVSDALTDGVRVEVQTFYKANNIDCYVMLVNGCDGEVIYVKIAYLSPTDQVLGASFHISDRV